MEVIEFGTINVSAGRTGKFLESAKKLSEFIHQIDLPKSENDQLVQLIIDQTEQAELGAFHYGMKIGIEYGRSEETADE